MVKHKSKNILGDYKCFGEKQTGGSGKLEFREGGCKFKKEAVRVGFSEEVTFEQKLGDGGEKQINIRWKDFQAGRTTHARSLKWMCVWCVQKQQGQCGWRWWGRWGARGKVRR